MNYSKYSRENIHFFDRPIPLMLKEVVNRVKGIFGKVALVDLGCGDGTLLYQLYSNGLLSTSDLATGVDFSKQRCDIARDNLENTEIICSDVSSTPIKKASFNLAVSTMVIEHLPDPDKFLEEVSRILIPKGFVYVTSIVHKKYGFYIYRNQGKFVLDPTHVNEFSSVEEFKHMFVQKGLKPKEVNVHLVRYPILDLFIRFLIKCKLLKPTNNLRHIFEKSKILNLLRSFLVIPILGFYTVEGVFIKR